MQIPAGPLSATTAAQLSALLNDLEQRVPRGRPQVPQVNALSGGHFGGQGVTGDTALNLPFLAKITGQSGSTNVYSWEAVLATAGGWVANTGMRTGSTTTGYAYEVNNDTDIAIGSIVEMRRGYFGPTTGWIYTFVAPGGVAGGGSGCSGSSTPVVVTYIDQACVNRTLTINFSSGCYAGFTIV